MHRGRVRGGARRDPDPRAPRRRAPRRRPGLRAEPPDRRLRPDPAPLDAAVRRGHDHDAGRRATARASCFHHATDLETTRRHGLPVTTPIRTLRDLAATRPEHEVERAASEALVLKLDHRSTTSRPSRARAPRRLRRPHRRPDPQPPRARLPQSGVDVRPATTADRTTASAATPSTSTGRRHRLVVETDGDRYHDHPLARRRDARKNADAPALGYTVAARARGRARDAPAPSRAALSRPASRTAS